MKFGQYLRSHAIDEWRRAYIDYRQLKKQIGRAEQELVAIDAGERDEAPSSESDETDGHAFGRSSHKADRARAAAARAAREAAQGGAAGPNLIDSVLVGGMRDIERGEGESTMDEDDEAEEDEDVPPRQPTQARRTFSGATSSAQSGKDEAAGIDVPPLSPSPSDSPPEQDSDATRNSSHPFVHDGSRRDDSAQKPSMPRSRPSYRDFDTPGKRRWRAGFTPDMKLDELKRAMPKQSRRFLSMLDHELERVSGFYGDREDEAVKRYEQLSAQWHELISHKKEFQALRQRELQPPQIVSSILPKHAHIPSVPGANLVRRKIAQRRTHQADSEEHTVDNKQEQSLVATGHTQRSRSPNTQGRDDPPTPGTHQRKEDVGADADDEATSRPRNAFRHGKPEEYASARSRLKLATFEYYRFLGMLKSYRVLNRTGFTKALKKYEKITLIPCAARYKEKVDAANFVKSTKLDDLIRETEDAFASVFERGDRKKALERLRDFGDKKRHHFTSWRAGIFMGAGFPLMVEGLVLSFKASTRNEIPYWQSLLQLFGAFYIPIFFSLAFFLVIAAWSTARINYVLVFEFDIRTKMDYHQFIELPALLYFILSLFWWAAWNNFWPAHIAPSAYPLAWLVVTVVIMLNPFPVLYASARWWLLRSLCRVVSSGLVRVEFRDFFLADLLNSLYYPLYNLGFLYCTYNHHWVPQVFQTCSTNATYTSAALASLPALFRLGQSIRRYFDSDGVNLHLLNAVKYVCTILYFWMYFSWRVNAKNGNNEVSRYVLFIVFATINSCATGAWDVLMDWSLGHRDVKKRSHWLLRNELAFFRDAPWIYYIAAVLNTVLRFNWVIYLAPHPAPGVQSYIIALVEGSRRVMWALFRVEAEHIGNRDGYRVTRDVPLPYVSANSPEAPGRSAVDDDDDDGADSGLSRKAQFFQRIHAVHRNVVENFEPLFDSVFSAKAIGLGRLEDSTEREQRKLEHEARSRRRRRNSSDEESGVTGNDTDPDDARYPRISQGAGHDAEKRQTGAERELERRRRRRKSIFVGEGDDESSSTPDTATDSGQVQEDPSPPSRPKGKERRMQSPRPKSPLGAEQDSSDGAVGDESDADADADGDGDAAGDGDGDGDAAGDGHGDGDIGEERLSGQPKKADDPTAPPHRSGPSPSEMDDPVEDEALRREIAEAEHMTDIANANTK